MMATDTILALAEAARAAPSPDNFQPFSMRLRQRELELFYDQARVGGRTFGPASQATWLALGCAYENLVQFCDAHQLQYDIELSSGPVPGLTLALSEQATRLNAGAAEHPLFRRHTNRFSFQKTPLEAAVIGTIESMSEGAARLAVTADRDLIARVGKLVEQASHIRFQTREVHEWLGQCLRFSAAEVAHGDGLDTKTMDLPPGGAMMLKFSADWRRMQFLNRLGAYRFMAGVDAAPVKGAQDLVFVTAGIGAEGALDAGRLLQRAWIALNDNGVAVHPYYVIADQLERRRDGMVPAQLVPLADAIAEQSSELLGTAEHESLLMVLRVGLPKQDPVRSRRLALETLTVANE